MVFRGSGDKDTGTGDSMHLTGGNYKFLLTSAGDGEGDGSCGAGIMIEQWPPPIPFRNRNRAGLLVVDGFC